jgi:hypothetical protein
MQARRRIPAGGLDAVATLSLTELPEFEQLFFRYSRTGWTEGEQFRVRRKFRCHLPKVPQHDNTRKILDHPSEATPEAGAGRAAKPAGAPPAFCWCGSNKYG